MKRKVALIEVLIVVVIVGLLMSLLLPAMSSGRSRARLAAGHVFEPDSTSLEGRLIVRTASLTVEVADIKAAASDLTELIEKAGGYVLSTQEHSDDAVSISAKIPAAFLTNALDTVDSFGRVKHRRVSSTDVTATYVDHDAKLSNDRALRDRLRILLDKAVDVKDILAIEKELTRIQGEVDSHEGQLKRLKADVEYASLEVTIREERVLGPLGWLLKWTWWCVKKLFIISG